MHERDSSPIATSTVTKRRVLAGVATVGLGAAGLATTGSDTARADVTLGEFDADGDSATLGDAPSSIPITAAGEWAVDGSTMPSMVRVTLQVHVEGEKADDLATDAAYDATSGSYELNADLLDHGDVTGASLMPADPGATNEVELLVRVIVTAVKDGELMAENHVEDTVTLVIEKDGVKVKVGGSANVEVKA